MALNFKNLKDPKLGLTDKITFGKLKDCRVCDVIEDYFDYLLWAETQGYIKFQAIVKETILEVKANAAWVEPKEVPVENLDDSLRRRLNKFHGGYSSNSKDYDFKGSYYDDPNDDIPF